MKKASVLTVMATMLLGACSTAPAHSSAPATEPTPSPAPASEAPMPSIEFKPEALRQTIDGFGASGCWWAKDVGGWQADKVDQIVGLLFDSKTGIGLNIYRFEVGGGDVNNAPDPWRRAETFETAPGQYDWGRDANSVSVLRKAVSTGVDNVVFFANTPPGRMTISGKTTGEDNGGPNLAAGLEGDFASYLTDIALHFAAEGIPVKYISPINEPQWNWKESNGQEGCHYEPDQIVNVAEALAAELARRGTDIKPSLIDSGKWFDDKYTVQLYKRLAEHPVVGPQLDHYAVHSYWSDATDKQVTGKLLQQTGVTLPLWQTEWCQMEGDRDLGMDAALVLARTVHEDMTILDCASWTAWIAVSCYDYKDGLVYVDLDDRDVFDSKRLWALGNYSRFIEPGYRRMELGGECEGLLASAYLSPDGQTAVLVAVNNGQAEQNVSIGAAGYATYEAYETSTDHSLELVSSGKPGEYRFPPQSVTTIICKK